MADENATVVLDRVNEPPAQTWNRLRANDITLTVPKISRATCTLHFPSSSRALSAAWARRSPTG